MATRKSYFYHTLHRKSRTSSGRFKSTKYKSTCRKAGLNVVVVVVESDVQTQERSQEANEVIESDDEAPNAYEEMKWMIRLKMRQMRRLNSFSIESRNGNPSLTMTLKTI